MKKLSMLLVLALLLTGCSRVKETIETQSTNEVSTNDSLDDTFYRYINLKVNSSRDDYYNDFNKSKDFQTIGRELEVLSTPHFSTDNYYMAVGQQIPLATMQKDLLRWKGDENPYSLQPAKDEEIDGNKNVIMVGSVYEIDFYKKSGDKYTLEGMSFGIVIDPMIKEDNQNPKALSTVLSSEVIEEYGRECIKTFYEYLSNDEELSKLPAMICVYQATNPAESYTNGKYILSSYCNESLGSIEKLEYNNVIFTSSDAEKEDAVTSSEFAQFKSVLKNKATEAIGVIGYGRYKDGDLKSLNIKLNVNVKTYAELEYIISIAAEDLNSRFSAPVDITVEVHSQDAFEAFIIKERGNDAKSFLTNY